MTHTGATDAVLCGSQKMARERLLQAERALDAYVYGADATMKPSSNFRKPSTPPGAKSSMYCPSCGPRDGRN